MPIYFDFKILDYLKILTIAKGMCFRVSSATFDGHTTYAIIFNTATATATATANGMSFYWMATATATIGQTFAGHTTYDII